MWLQILEDMIEGVASEYRARGDERGAQVLDRIAKSVDDVPVALMMAYARLYEAYDYELDEEDWDSFKRATSIDDALVRDIVRLNFKDATEYVSELLRRCGVGVLD
jgi:hypothetical protein